MKHHRSISTASISSLLFVLRSFRVLSPCEAIIKAADQLNLLQTKVEVLLSPQMARRQRWLPGGLMLQDD